MARRNLRVRVDGRGRLEVVDPGFDSLDVLREVDPDFGVRQAPIEGFIAPRFQALREAQCAVRRTLLPEVSETSLWELHRAESWPDNRPDRASVLELKIEIARRILYRCRLCARRCGVNRHAGEAGVCGLGPAALVAEHFVHIGEEPPINPSLVLSLAGCGLRCRYCQQGDILDPRAVAAEPLSAELWSRLDAQGARTLSFVGGNPDESLYGVLRFLNAAPRAWRLPVVWNCHAYATPETLELLEGAVDVWVPDLKYANESCALRLSGVSGYPGAAQTGIRAMLASNVPVIVRILVLPGHVECCHFPALRFLRSVNRPNLLLSIRGQYCPDWRITAADGALAERSAADEVRAVIAHADRLGLRFAGEQAVRSDCPW